MNERPPATSEHSPVAPQEQIEPRLEQAAAFADREPADLAEAGASHAVEHRDDPSVLQRVKRYARSRVATTVLAFATTAGALGMMPKPAEAGLREIAEVGAVAASEADRALADSYYEKLQQLGDLTAMRREIESEREHLVRSYEQIAQRIARVDRDLERTEGTGSARSVRRALEYRDTLRDEQQRIRDRTEALDEAEKRIAAGQADALKSAKKQQRIRTGARILGAVLEAASRRR